MTRLSWALLGVLPLATAVACGGGEDRPRGDGGAETGGKSGTGGKGGKTGTGGSGGESETGGASGSGGVLPDSGPPPDTTPPTFDGATGVEIVAEDRVSVSWDAASDDVSPAKRLAYYVYRATESGAEDFTRAKRCTTPDPEGNPQAEARLPCFVTAGAGTTSAVVRDIIPAHPYFFVVRAVDEAGNEDDNVNEVTAQTDDTTGPEFGGVRTVKVVTATSLRVSWGPGYDLASSDAQLKFRVYASAGVAPDPEKDKPVLTSKAGEHEAVLDTLDPLTAYKVMVRALDPTGNEDANVRVLGATTPEGQPPTFDGASRALEEGLDANGKAKIRVFWPPATDNITDVANIVYDVYQSTRSHGQKYATPTYTSTPGSSSLLVTGLEPGTKYFYVVRARDVAGNEEDNIKEVSALTRPLDVTAPTFAGASAVTSETPTSLKVTWSQANDAVTLVPAAFQYLVYFSTSTPVDSSGVPFMVVPGATTATIGGLAPGTDYHVVVRAKDLAGNVSAAGADKTGKTLAADPSDTTAPAFTATPTVTVSPQTPTSATVAWTAATDAGGANNVRYLVCASMARTDCEGSEFFRHVYATTPFGQLSAVAQFLTTRTDYNFAVRAEDKAGNYETGLHFLLKATPASFSTDVAPILSSRCGACHDFSTVARIVGVKSQINWRCPADPNGGCTLELIDAANPELSAIYRKVNPPNQKTAPFSDAVPNEYTGLQEPRDTIDKLSPPEDDALRVWIVQGAFGN